MAIRKNLYDVLLDRFTYDEKLRSNMRLTKETLDKSVKEAREDNVELGEYMVRKGYVTEDTIMDAYSIQCSYEIYKSNGENEIDKDVLQKLNMNDMRKFEFIPVDIDRVSKTITICVCNPNKMGAEDIVKSVYPSYRIKVMLIREADIEGWLEERASGLSVDSDAFGKITVGSLEESRKYDIRSDVDDAEIVKIVNSLFDDAINRKASDIHIEPGEKELSIRFRIDGILKKMAIWPMKIHPAVVTRLKMMANMDISESRKPQGGKAELDVGGEKEVDIRVSTLPTIYGEKVTLRILDKTKSRFDISMMSLRKEEEAKYRKLLTRSNGIILVTGPTGSGKSTSLYASMTEVSNESINVVTLEDPVEYKLNGINQVQINPGAGLTFEAGLREILRQDPDIILIGEIRDAQTAIVATQASNTGHLVFSTLHTNDAASSVTRLIDMGVEPFMVSSSLIGVVNQRLVRRVCQHCKKEYMLGDTAKDEEIREYIGLKPGEQVKLIKGDGCRYCNNTGYKGRIPLEELLIVDDDIRELLSGNCKSIDIKRVAIKNGMKTLKEDGLLKAKEGLTTVEEVRRVAN